MLSVGVLPEEWERFAASLGRESDPISSEEMTQLLTECGFSHITRYLGRSGWRGIMQFETSVKPIKDQIWVVGGYGQVGQMICYSTGEIVPG